MARRCKENMHARICKTNEMWVFYRYLTSGWGLGCMLQATNYQTTLFSLKLNQLQKELELLLWQGTVVQDGETSNYD